MALLRTLYCILRRTDDAAADDDDVLALSPSSSEEGPFTAHCLSYSVAALDTSRVSEIASDFMYAFHEKFITTDSIYKEVYFCLSWDTSVCWWYRSPEQTFPAG